MMGEKQEILPEGWVDTTIEEIAYVGAGNPAPQGEKYFSNAGPWFVRVQDMGRLNGSKYLRNPKDKLSPEGNSGLKLFPKGTILFTKSGASTLLNQRAILPQDSYLVSHIGTAIPANEVSSDWMYYFLVTVDFAKFAHGANMPSLPIAKAKKIPIPLPPSNEQRRIVAKIEALFSRLDKGVESLKTARAQLKTYRQAVLKHAFEGKLTAGWREDNKDKLEPAEKLLARIKQERQTRYQQQLKDWQQAVKDWEDGGKEGKKPAKPKKPAQLPELSKEEQSGLTPLPTAWVYSRVGLLIDEPKYGTSKKCDYEFDGLGVLRIPNIVSGLVDDNDLKFAEFDGEEIQTYALNTGDILIIRSNGSVSIVGKCALISEHEEQYLYAGYLIRLRPNNQIISSKYLLALLSSHLLRAQIEAKAKSTSGVNNINSGELQSLIIPVCCLEEQAIIMEEIAAALSSIDNLENEIDSQLKKSEALRQSILKKAFSGRLVPQDPDDEPASVLLERIRAEKAALAKPKTKTKKKPKRKTAA